MTTRHVPQVLEKNKEVYCFWAWQAFLFSSPESISFIRNTLKVGSQKQQTAVNPWTFVEDFFFFFFLESWIQSSI